MHAPTKLAGLRHHVPLKSGQAKRVTFVVHPSRLAFYNPRMRFVVEPGAYRFSVGASSRDIHAEQTGQTRRRGSRVSPVPGRGDLSYGVTHS